MKQNKRKLILFVFTFVISCISIFAQDTISFNNEYHLPETGQYSYLKLRKVNNNQVLYREKAYAVQLPTQFIANDTAIAFIYFTGWKKPKIPKTTALLFGNYASHRPVLYVDYNHNLDFSDDGTPLMFDLDSTIIVYLKNSEVNTASLPFKLFYPKLSEKNKYYVEKVLTNNGEEIVQDKLLPIDYWVGCTEMNYKVINTKLNGQNIRIGLHDFNANGLYNDIEQDRILIGDYEKNTLPYKLSDGAVVYTQNTQILINEVAYDVIEIEPTGQYISIKKSNKTYVKPLDIGDNIAHVQLKLISNKKEAIADLQEDGKYTVLYFWGTWCKGCTKRLPELKELAEKEENRLQIIGLNERDKKRRITEYLNQYQINWLNGYATEEIIKLLRIDSFPTYVLLDSTGEIKIMNASLSDIEETIRE